MLILAAEKDQEALQISEALDQHLSYENWIKKKGKKRLLILLVHEHQRSTVLPN
jgi:hypothetical protein